MSKFYIGYTKKPVETRLQKHFEGQGSEWTRRYAPVEVVETFPGDPFDEDSTTKRYMAKYGIKNVRGGSYCQVSLPDNQVKTLEKELKAGAEVCYRCGEPGHFITNCPRSEMVDTTRPYTATFHRSTTPVGQKCMRCGRNTHTEESCYAKTHLNGKELTATSIKPDNNTSNVTIYNAPGCKKRLAGKIRHVHTAAFRRGTTDIESTVAAAERGTTDSGSVIASAVSPVDIPSDIIPSESVVPIKDSATVMPVCEQGKDRKDREQCGQFVVSDIVPSRIELEVGPDAVDELCERCGRPVHSFLTGGLCLYTHDIYSNPITPSIVTKTLDILKRWFW